MACPRSRNITKVPGIGSNFDTRLDLPISPQLDLHLGELRPKESPVPPLSVVEAWTPESTSEMPKIIAST